MYHVKPSNPPFIYRFHHSNGDSMLVEDSGVLDKCTALWAAASYIIADLNDNMPRDICECESN